MNILLCMPQGQVRDTFFTKENMALLQQLGQVTLNQSEQNFTQAQYAEAIKDQDVVIIGWHSPRLDEAVLQCANRLKLVVHTAGSVEPFLCDAVYQRQIKVIGGNELMAQSVAEGIIAYILAFNREIPRFQQGLTREGQWKPQTFSTLSLVGKTVGIVSDGAISRYLMAMLQGFNVTILLYTRSLKTPLSFDNVRLVPLETLFEQSDYISLQTALNEHTMGMIDARYLRRIKPNAVFINTARAKVVNEVDLLEGLTQQRFAAILDVHYQEPLPRDNPYAALPNVFLMPHMAGPTNECRALIAKTLLQVIPEVLAGGTSIHEVDQAKFQSMSKAM